MNDGIRPGRKARAIERAELFPKGLRRCIDCEQVLPLAKFGRNAKYLDGLQPQCGDCIAQAKRQGTKTVRDIAVEETEAARIIGRPGRLCPACARYLPLEAFPNLRPRGATPRCAECRGRTWKRKRRRANPPPADNPDLFKEGLRRCAMCREIRQLEDFYRNPTNGKVFSYCRPCATAYVKRVRRKGATTDLNRQARLGITPRQVADLRYAQGGKCAICGSATSVLKDGQERSLDVDHDHETGEVRGLLCIRCNRGIGIFGDRVELLLTAAQYLLNPPARGLFPDRSEPPEA